jgi:hypothetical protein
MFNIARNIYAGWDASTASLVLPEAEIIPIGSSANEKRKIDNVAKKYPNLFEHENIPLPGFTLFKVSRRGWSSSNMSWLIIDPRGFLVRITNQNLEEILHVTGITEGLIQEKCVWARDDSSTKMTLVPISSPKYLEAVTNTALIEGKVELKDVQIGDTVLLQNSLKGIYKGVISLYGPLNNYSVQEEYRAQTLLRKQVIEVTPGKYHYQTDLKILKILDKTSKPSTREDSAAEMNQHIKAGTSYFTQGTNMSARHYSIQGIIKFASVHAVPKLPLSFEEVDKLEATRLFYDATSGNDIGMLALGSSSGLYILDVPYNYSGVTPSIQSFEVCELKNKVENAEKIILKTKRKSYFVSYTTKSTTTQKLDNFTKFYKIVKHVKGETFI